MASVSSTFHLSIGSRFENIDLVQVVLQDRLEDIGLDEEARHWIDLAVREALANAIKHGNRQQADKRVEVDCELGPDHLVIQVLDQGEGFDPDALEDPLEPENLLRPSGRGILYMRNFMDEIEIGPAPEGGTLVVLKKRLDAREET